MKSFECLRCGKECVFFTEIHGRTKWICTGCKLSFYLNNLNVREPELCVEPFVIRNVKVK